MKKGETDNEKEVQREKNKRNPGWVKLPCLKQTKLKINTKK